MQARARHSTRGAMMPGVHQTYPNRPCIHKLAIPDLAQFALLFQARLWGDFFLSCFCAGYRESAAFLERAADQLEAMLHNNDSST